MKTLTFAALLFASGAAASAPTDSFCVKIGRLAEITARAMESGATEDQFARKAVAAPASKDKSRAKVDHEVDRIAENMVAYVYTVKLPSKDARLTGYQKCMAGDFN